MSTSPAKPIWSISAITFLNFAARGFTIPFISLYMLAIGFTGTQIGIVLSVSAAFRLVVPLALNALADRTNQHRKLFYGLVTGNAVTTLGLVLAALPKPLMGGMVVMRDSFDMPSASLLSQLTITRLKQADRDIYGRIRAWGSLGWGVTTMFSGLIFAAGGYALMFVISAGLNIFSLIFGRGLPQQTTDAPLAETAERVPFTPPPRPASFYIVMVSWFLFYIGVSSVNGFMNPFFQEELGASTAMIGVLASVAALAEIPAMMVIDRMMRRVNFRVTMLLGIAGTAGLWFAFTLLDSVNWLIPLMVVRGVFFTMQTIANTLLVSQISHPSNAATNQSITQVTVPALAQLVSAPLAGWIYDVLGARTLFQLVAVVALSGALLLVVLGRQLRAVESPMGRG